MTNENNMETKVSYSRFALFVYPWVDMYPSEDPSLERSGPAVEIPNITGLSFSRSKSNPSNVLTVTVIGPVHWALRPGNWVILKSSVLIGILPSGSKSLPFDTDPNETARQKHLDPKHGIPRFIGQISAFETRYSADGDGTLRRISIIKIREWSDCLNIPVRYDSVGLGAFTSKNANPFALTMLSADVLRQAGFVDDAETMASAYYNAFEFAQVALRFVGALSANNQDNKELANLNYNYPEVATRLPTLPKTLFEALGLTVKDPNMPFATGFVTTIFGVQNKPIKFADFNSIKKFYGLYPAEVVDQMSKPGMLNPFFDRNPKNRPISMGKIPLLYTGAALWSVLQENTDPYINELFTDFIYTYKTGVKDVEVGARPAIFMRDKPFTMRKYLTPGSTDQWTIYDDIPRITVDLAYVTNMTVSNTFVTSPNYISLNYSSETTSKVAQMFQRFESTTGPIQHKGDMSRFGGHEEHIDTKYVDTTPNEGIVQNQEESSRFFGSLLKVMDQWYTQKWKMANISLSLKDPGYPLTVGHNIELDLGGWSIVGHIESISTSSSVSGDGQWSTTTDVELSRVVKINSLGQLDFIPIHQMGNLLGETIEFTPSEYNEYNQDVANFKTYNGALFDKTKYRLKLP